MGQYRVIGLCGIKLESSPKMLQKSVRSVREKNRQMMVSCDVPRKFPGSKTYMTAK